MFFSAFAIFLRHGRDPPTSALDQKPNLKLKKISLLCLGINFGPLVIIYRKCVTKYGRAREDESSHDYFTNETTLRTLIMSFIG